MNAFYRTRTLYHKLLKHIVNRITPNQDKTLVIIDMQSGFMNKDEYDIVPAICTLIRHAKYNNWGIVVVEFGGHGETDKKICELLIGYSHYKTVYKEYCDGSSEVLEVINLLPRWSLDIVICGIYGPECVAATVDGLLSNSIVSEVDVVEDAVYPAYCPYVRRDEDEENDYQLQAGQVNVEDVVGSRLEGSVVG